MAIDLSTLPLKEIQDLLGVVTGKVKFTLAMLPEAVKILSWITDALKGSEEQPLAILSGEDSGVSDEAALEALVNGTAVPDGAAGGSVFVSIAVGILAKVVTKILADYFATK